MKKPKSSGLVRVAVRFAACSIDAASSIARRAGQGTQRKEEPMNKTSSNKAAAIAGRVMRTGRYNQEDVETLAASVLAQKVKRVASKKKATR